ncbi:hypothetical protein [Ktedonobacter racemifer]|uniref:Transposase n=1 Tax=Ktedonobacter racemifer DSM 44963 TaxID=485913 RepID=D6TYM4_KTERA|nr:hypothetical protein [Ktedonobacter racemifer]EFH85099.1 hypothetical protein Krac_6254 [Ktedonobacter racemifer DSM 44963]
MYCPTCDARDHADRNASRVIGQRLLARFRAQEHHQEKPQAPLQAERPAKAGGGRGSQAAQPPSGGTALRRTIHSRRRAWSRGRAGHRAARDVRDGKRLAKILLTH